MTRRFRHGPRARPTQILHVEDNPADVELVREALSLFPRLSVTAVSNGGEALYDSEELAEEAIKTHQQDTMSNNEMDEDYAREHWEIKEYEMTWAAYFALPEFDGW